MAAAGAALMAASCLRCASSSSASSSRIHLGRSTLASSSSLDLASLRATLPSASGAPVSTRQFTSSAAHLEKKRKRIARLKRKSNLERRELTSRLLESSKPDPILGHLLGPQPRASIVNQNANAEAAAAGLAPTTGGEEVWTRSDLAKIILSHDEVWGVREDRRGELVPIDPAEFVRARGGEENGVQSPGGILPGDEQLAKDQERFGGPLRLNFGLSSKDRELLFDELPRVMVEDHMLDSRNLGGADPSQNSELASLLSSNPISPASASTASGEFDVMNEDAQKALTEEMEELERAEAGSADVLARVLDLRNASARGIRFENTRRIIQAFGRKLPDGRLDTGNTEVQVALLTYRIRNMHSHLANARHDNHNRRQMNIMVHKRAKLLKYLKRTEPQQYQSLLPRVGLLPRAVEGELILPGKPKVGRM
ncbi:hypothetical protein OC846_000824 [Tilletia horrida]|uniref:Ribosomal protein S15 n=1 Tax=Tilletia horrida TaxID=155126 RepID=A0AAN6GV92_9BASI|nr:hypothetical protein OC845_002334 [Tilletia horrida]KAK0556979.1 hypothetical protein OC846_000824 [Tilletia horrida]KAK0566673.1 hypothetical protein OC861_003114 [Tilletia horrida]